VRDWEEVAHGLVQRVHREAVGGVPDDGTKELLADVLAMPGVPERWRTPDFATPLVPIIPICFAKDGVRVCYFSMVTTVGTPQDIAAQEIRVESFFPVDDETTAYRW
jgi:hypothetical protein